MRFDRATFWSRYREEYGRVDQETVDAIEFLLKSFETDERWTLIPTIAYAFATIKHETAHTFRPITEYGGVRYFDKYDTGKLARKLGNSPEKDGDGYKYRGRGYVQLTGKSNYAKYGIASKPEQALDPQKAFEIMTDGMHTGAYTGKKLSDYFTARKADYINARRIINGTDKAAVIAKYAKQFESILNSAASIEKPATSNSKPHDLPVETASTPPINQQTVRMALPTLKRAWGWLGSLSGVGFLGTAYSALNGMPSWAVLLLGVLTGAVVVGLIAIVINHRNKIAPILSHIAETNADPALNNIEVVK